jgi:hypothetical protein
MGSVALRVYRLNAVGKDGRVMVLGTADNATQALRHLKDAFGDYPRAWVTDEQDHDVSWAELVRLSDEEQKSDQGSD